MTKEKIKKTLKRLPVILQELKSLRQKTKIRRRRKGFIIDKEVIIIIETIDEIIENEKVQWVKNLLIKLKLGWSDIRILSDMPISRAEYYLLKNRLIEKIYSCCVYKGLIEYEDILKERID